MWNISKKRKNVKMEIPGVPFIIDRKEYVYKIQFNIPDYFL